MIQAQIDTSYVVGLIIIGVFCLIGSLCGIAWWLFDPFEHGRGWSFAEGGLIGGGSWVLFLGLFTLMAFPPLPGQYNTYVPKSGIVAKVGTRFIASDTSGGGSTEKFAVQLTNGQVYGCNDTRCSVLKPGQPVTLLCERVFQWNSSEGWDCNFGAYRLN